MNKRYEIRNGKYGSYFFDTDRAGFSLTLEMVLEKLNRNDEYKMRLAKANKKRPLDKAW